jgi:hypothetical protein
MSSHRNEPVELEVQACEGGYELLLGDASVRTSIGDHPVRHEAAELLDHMIGEFMKYPTIGLIDDRIEEPRFLGSYALFGLQKEFIESGIDNLSENFAFEVLSDPILNRPPGPESIDQLARYGAVTEWLESESLRLVDADFVDLTTIVLPDDYWRLSGSIGDEDTEEFHRLVARLHALFRGLEPEGRAGVVFLHNAHEGSLIHGLALMLGKCSVNEYAAGVGAAHGVIVTFGDVRESDHGGAFDELKADATAAVEYVKAYQKGTIAGELKRILAESAEGTDIEFKSTLRRDLKLETNSREVTESVLKTVAAFVNTNGGTLVIGVADDKTLVGIERDNFSSDDAFLRHFHTVVMNAMGPVVVTRLVEAKVVPTPTVRVCLVKCARSPEPVLCKLQKTPDAFFVRTGPASINLIGEDRETFQRVHWGPRS